MVEQTLHYGDLRVPYTVRFTLQKNRKLAIHVDPDGSVHIRAPAGLSLAEVKRAVLRQARWIARHAEGARQRRRNVLDREYVSGESHLYLGKRHVLKVRESRSEEPAVRLWRGQLQVTTRQRHSDIVRELLGEWYRRHASRIFEQRLSNVCADLSWVKSHPPLRLRDMTKQWGSCSPSGLLTLNPHLVKAPVRCIDYVLIHELCHLKHHNHSAGFYRLLSRRMPDWKSAKDRLDDLAEVLLNA